MAVPEYSSYKPQKNSETNRMKLRESNVKGRSFFRVIGFFLAMAVPYGELAPFGLSFLAQERKFSVGAILSFAAVSLGSFAVCDRLGAAKYICAGIIYIAVLFVLDKDVRMKELTAGLAAGAGIFVAGLVTVFWQGFSLGELLLLLCETAAVVAGALVIEKSVGVIQREKLSAETIDGEEKLSLGAVVALAVMGLKEIYVGSYFSVMNVVAIALLLVVAAGCGTACSTGAGVIIGIICGLGSDEFLPILGAFSFCGFLSGMFSKFGKGGVISGVVLANAILIVYTNGAMEAILTLYEIMAASVIFLFVKQKIITKVGEVICFDATERAGIKRIKTALREKLAAIAASLETMARTLETYSEKKNQKNTADIATVFDLAADKVCKKCRKSSECWNKNFDFTYHSLFELMSAMDENGSVSPFDVNEKFRAVCVDFPRLVAELNHQLDLNQVRCVWKSKVQESRTLVGEQLSGVSKVIGGLSEEIESDIAFRSISVREVEAAFEEKEIELYRVKVSGDTGGRQYVELCIRRTLWNERVRRETERIMRSLFRGEISIREMSGASEYFVSLEVCDAEKFVVETSFAERALSERNGDNYRFSHISGGKYVIALSDGMGTGSQAARESEAMLELLDSFLRAGFDSCMAVKFLNSIMLLKSDEDSFVTMDVCIIDLYTGEAEFIKTGAEPSFIMRSNRVDTVKAASLPVGVIAEMEAEIASKTLGDGDVIIMVTDGIETRDCGSMWISEFVNRLGGESPDKNLAQEILEQAVRKNDGQINDDMTVLSVKIRCA
ncbi:MAG: stage II sporulation protein E [Clostridia bacterium]|nr:stage II sporulation protein E [Clostridia bacterium]